MVLDTERLTPAIGATVLDPRVPAALVEGDHPAAVDAVHDLGAFRSSSWLDGGQQALDVAIARTGVAVHPIIARHPFTGRPYLNVSESFTRWVIGASAPESARLLTMSFDMINRPEFHARLRWRAGTLAIWDNRGTQHYAVADDARQP